MSYQNRKILVIVPARSGSVGIPNKNIKDFCDYPLFLWSVKAALDSELVDCVAISSDYTNITLDNKVYYRDLKELYFDFVIRNKKVRATNFMQRVCFIKRPDYLCQSDSTTESCLLHCLETLEEKFDYVVALQPTSPLRNKKMINDAIKCIISDKKNSLLSVEQFTPFFLQKDGNKVKWHYDPDNRKMRQDLEENEFFYHDDGNLYITKTSFLQNFGCRLDSEPYLYINDPLCSKQIDSELDWLILETIFQKSNSSKYVSFGR